MTFTKPELNADKAPAKSRWYASLLTQLVIAIVAGVTSEHGATLDR